MMVHCVYAPPQGFNFRFRLPMIGSTQHASHGNLTSLSLGEFFNPCGTLAGSRAFIAKFREAGWVEPIIGSRKRKLKPCGGAYTQCTIISE